MALRARFINKLLLNRNSYAVARYSTNIDENNVIVTTDDHNVIVCWHPEKQYAYENTLPLPEKAPVAESHFKVQTSKELKSLYKPKTEDEYRAELMKMTYTLHHQWFINKWQFRKKKEPKFPRPYL